MSATAPPIPADAAPRARLRIALGAVWRDHRTLLAILALYAGGSLLVGPVLGWPALSLSRQVVAILWGVWLAVGVAGLLAAWVRGTVRIDRASGWTIGPLRAARPAWREARARWLSPTRLAGAVIVALILPLAAGVFTGWKLTVLDTPPATVDAALVSLDRWLHGGRLPHEWLRADELPRWLWRSVDGVYFLAWTITTASAPAVAAWAPPSPRRSRYLVAHLLLLAILGNAVAVAAASAGPLYYSAVVPGEANPYAALMARVADAAPWAISVQRYLWSGYAVGAQVAGGGISAFPSLHVASATLVALATWRLGVAARLAALAYLAAILLGSVLLGWHYAVDGYAGIAGTLVIWWIAGWLMRPRAPCGPDDHRAPS